MSFTGENILHGVENGMIATLFMIFRFHKIRSIFKWIKVDDWTNIACSFPDCFIQLEIILYYQTVDNRNNSVGCVSMKVHSAQCVCVCVSLAATLFFLSIESQCKYMSNKCLPSNDWGKIKKPYETDGVASLRSPARRCIVEMGESSERDSDCRKYHHPQTEREGKYFCRTVRRVFLCEQKREKTPELYELVKLHPNKHIW